MKFLKNNIRFLLISFVLIFLIISSALYISNLLFTGKNSYEVYAKLKVKKIQLQNDIRNMQFENATLQKNI